MRPVIFFLVAITASADESQSAGQCAIPLANVTPKFTPRMPTFNPPSGDTKMAVPPPMPVCAEEAKMAKLNPKLFKAPFSMPRNFFVPPLREPRGSSPN